MIQAPAPRRAVILGASIAGLLAARVLSEFFDEVVLLERDELPCGAAPRKGTPHALQPHGLLARGREILEELFPGITATWLAQGAQAGDLGETGFVANGRPFATAHAGHVGVAVSRLAIEAELRRRVRLRHGVVFHGGVEVLEPVYQDGAVTGVRFVHRLAEGATTPVREQRLAADLVVDCSGRASRTPKWLQRWGHAAPEEERVSVDLMYCSAYFERAEGAAPPAVIASATPSHPWPGVLLAQEPVVGGGPLRWVLGFGGYAGDHPEASVEALRERARRSGSVAMQSVAEHAQPLGAPRRYLFSHSQRRRYERLRRFPRGFLVMGDALCSFNPIYGQGMTVAACEALALRRVLAASRGADLHRRWFRACAQIIDTPWQLAVGGDLALPSVPGARPLAVRIVNAYIARLVRAAAQDARVALAFLRVVHLLAPPASLFAPALAWRVWRGARQDAPRAVAGWRAAAAVD